MEQLTIRATKAALPNIDEDVLEAVDALETNIGVVADFRFDDADLRSLELTGQRLTGGRISGLRVARAKLEDLRLDSVEWSGCDLSSVAWNGGKLSRVRFANCKILSGEFANLALEDVVFDRCKLDFASFTDIVAKGSVIFRECSLEETEFVGCDLGKAAFDDCRMLLTAFDRGTYKGMDLRGNDLSGLRGVAALKQAVIEPAQTIQLGQALAADLNLRLGDDDS